MKNKVICAAVAAAAAACATAEPMDGPLWFAGDDATAFELVSTDFYEMWLADRLSVGLEVSWATLTDAKRPEDWSRSQTFVGYINELKDDSQVTFAPVVTYWAARYVRATLRWDSVSGRTKNFNTATRHSDGVVEAAGPMLTVEGVLPLFDDTLLLHAGVGVVRAFCDFDEDTWWHLGFADQASWEALGREQYHTRTGHYREIEVDDAFGFALCAGASWRPAERFELDLSVRHVWLEPDCTFGYRYVRGFEPLQEGDFTLDHLAVSLSASWVF
ncbi:MAG: hypothetical protein IJ678_09090 [Kiritimatiellae bacterium]|nr:hypothetical protein [Kiritimatiellia bacterium]